MPDDKTPPVGGQDMRQWLREGTAQDHERLDHLLGACDLDNREGLTHFLLAHAIGLSAVAPAAASFVESTLHLAMPDPVAMIAQDLADLGVAMPKAIAPLPASGAAGVAYVLIGSRMGVAALRSRGYWSPGTPGFCRYMEDRSLLALWSPLLGWLKQVPESAPALTAARAAFAAFEQGLHAATILLAHDLKAPTPA